MRALIVGGGCRGLDLARDLVAQGHAVRMVTRRADAVAGIEAAGAEAFRGDPRVVGTLRYALDNVTVLLWLLATARGPAEEVAALHGSRLAMMLERTVDTTVRGVVYEAAGPVGPDALAAGEAEVRRAHATNEVPFRLLEADPADRAGWLRAAHDAVGALLGPR
jgi:NAD(P)-dependent dehydrogenase (short-subunit alcohol dehydrogenase family)